MKAINSVETHFFYFPHFNPVAFHIGPFAVHWYGLGYLFGIVLAYLYVKTLLKNQSLWHYLPLNYEQLSDFILWATLAIILGGRLGDVLLWEPNYYWHHWYEIVAVWHGGMAFHGGLMGVLIACIWFAKKNKINLFSLLDLVSAGAPIGLGIVRICNFINGELWGKATNMPWAVIFPSGGYIPRHPSQIYEALMEGLVLFIILYIAIYKFKALKLPGKITGLFCFFYAMARIIAEFFREKDPAPLWFENLFHNSIFSYGMFLSLPMILISIFFITYSHKQQNAT